MRSVNIALPDDLADKLIALADRERRTAKAQAAVVLEDALRAVDLTASDRPKVAAKRPARAGAAQ